MSNLPLANQVKQEPTNPIGGITDQLGRGLPISTGAVQNLYGQHIRGKSADSASA
jgi:hypothetical protein